MVTKPGLQWSTSATPWIAALAVLCSSTALSGVIEGGLWLVHIAVAIAVVTGTGALLRASRLPAPVVGLAQVLALLCLLVTIFTRSGFLVVLPGPTSLGDLMDVLGDSIAQVQSGVPPVEATPAIRCLVMVAIGLVTVLVDTLAVAAAAPAASGLVLLCVFAVPASLAEDMLPIWTFVFGAAAFALLLAVDGQHRHEAWRGRLGSGASTGSGSSATMVASIAMVIALVIGAGFTVVGTIGRLPGTGNGIGGNGIGGLGINPMTNLRGMLNQGRTLDVFKVRGLDEPSYLRLMTLDKYVPNKGWERGADPAGNPARGDLPLQPGDKGDGRITRVDIEPVRWDDYWLPLIGAPRTLDTSDGNYFFDAGKGMVFSTTKNEPERYRLDTVLDTPTANELRIASGGDTPIDRNYYVVEGVEQPVKDLAKKITEGKTNPFDKAVALYSHFAGPTSEFEYRLETKGDLTSDALSDFLFRGKVGYCEQYASAMAVLAREVGLPSRVALGFTAGYVNGDHRLITTEDAHAWVEIFFPGHGWVTFDPTPLANGRGVTPPYLSSGPATDEKDPTGSTSATTTTAPSTGSSSAASSSTAEQQNQVGAEQRDTSKDWIPFALIALIATGIGVGLARLLRRRSDQASRDPAGVVEKPVGRVLRRYGPAIEGTAWVLTVVLAVAWVNYALAIAVLIPIVLAVPATIRALRRRHRLGAVTRLEPGAATAAWQELLAESIDRGVLIPATDTIRTASRRLAREHSLDDAGREGLRGVIGAIERSWYSARMDADPGLPAAVAAVRASLARSAPLSLRAKLFPRSVLHPAPRPTIDEPVPV